MENNSFEYSGVWWTPDSPEVRVDGVLSFDFVHGAELRVFSSSNSLKILNVPSCIPIVFGLAVGGQQITLVDCLTSNITFGSSSSALATFLVSIVFVGRYFRSTQEMNFNNLTIRYSNIDDWFRISGIDLTGAFDPIERIIRYNKPKPITADLRDEYTCKIDFGSSISLNAAANNEVSIRSFSNITLTSAVQRDLHEWLENERILENFFTIAIDEPIYPLMLSTQVDTEPVKIFYKIANIFDMKTNINRKDMLFTFTDVAEKFENVLRNWFRNARQLKPVYDLFFSIMNNPHLYLENQFLSYTQGLEAFHRLVYGGTYMDEEDYTKVLKALQKAVNKVSTSMGLSDDLSCRIRDSFTYSNEYSLRKRLYELFDKYNDTFTLFLKPEDEKDFVNKVVNTRNYLTHYAKGKNRDIVRDRDLFYINQKLKRFLQICLLCQADLTQDEVRNFFTRNSSRYQWELAS